MEDVLNSLELWRERGEQIGLATVVETWGSAPRPVGSKMAITLSGGIAGSVSAGCVESAVIEECKEAVQSGRPRLLSFGVADDQAWEVGLACGGTIKVLVESFAAFRGVYGLIKQHLAAREPMAVVGVIDGPPEWLNHKLIVRADGHTEGDLALPDPLRQRAVDAAREMLVAGAGGMVTPEEGMTLFIDVYPPVPRLIIIGAVHIAEALVTMANLAGFDTIVIDPRGAFATEERFAHATRLIRDWPQHALPEMSLDGWAYVAVLTHDPKLDDPALMIALASDARYVGALGSRRTNQKRAERLRAAGLTDEQIARLHAPIGLPLGGRSPGEIAVSILAEIIQTRNKVSVIDMASATG